MNKVTKIAFVHHRRFANDTYYIKKISCAKVFPPLWALSLATYLKEAFPNVKIEIIDNQLLGLTNIFKKIEKGKFDIIGLSPFSIDYETILAIARFAKKRGSRIVLGGLHATALRKEILQNRGPKSSDYCVDAVIQHDGEKAFYEYVAGKPLSKINNLVYQEKDGEIKENTIEILDLDNLPSINYNSVNLESYFRLQPLSNKFGRMINFISHRGCVWREKNGACIFCCSMGRKARFRSPQKIRQEIEQLMKLYGVKLVYDVGDDFSGSSEWLKEISRTLSALKNKPNFIIGGRASRINLESIDLLRKINVKGISLGIESFSNKILRNMRKDSTAEINRKAIILLYKSKIIPSINLVFGSLNESRETLKETIKTINLLALKMQPRKLLVNYHLFGSLPGSPSWHLLLKKEKKYCGQDLINYQEVFHDWVKYFCKVSLAEIYKVERWIQKISEE